ncbi:MAG: HAD family hydrolase [Myxococcales bacterium]|nr:HAD family hydrolase [Myxococcales bacterium]
MNSVPRVAAFFDMDRTLLRCNTGTQWIRFLRRRGEISLWKTARAVSWILRYKLAILDMEAVTRVAIGDLAGDLEEPMIDKARAFFADEVVNAIAPRALVALEHHRREGHLVAILSSSTPYVAEPLARHLGIEHVLCTRLHVAGGRFVGTHEAPACYGAGKVHWAERFARERDVDLAASWFYTDSYSDLPMLLRVGVPKVVNPDPRLRRHAQRAGWPMEEW